MNGLDTAILVVMGLSALLGAIRGMLTEVLSLLVWVAALWLSVTLGDDIGASFTGIETPMLRALAGYSATFAGVVVVGNLLVWLLRTLLHGAGLSGTDRLLGVGFGAVRGYAIVLALVLLVSFTPWANARLARESTLMPAFSVPAGWIAATLPDHSELVAFARPVSSDAPSTGSSDRLPPIAGLDLAPAAQWLGLTPQDGHPVLREWAAQAGLGTAPADDPARIAPTGSGGDDPARIAPAAANSVDPANTQHPNPESN